MAHTDYNRTYIYINLTDFEEYELLAVSQLGPNLFRVVEIPFFTDVVNLHDLVQCEEQDAGNFYFVKVVKPSGHKTLQFAVDKRVDRDEWHKFLKSLIPTPYKFRNVDRFFAVDYPPRAEYEKACAELNELIEKGVLTREQMVKLGGQ